MALYICIALEKSDVIEAVPVEASDDLAALQHAMAICGRHPQCTRVEVWQGGKKLQSYLAPQIKSA